MPFALFLNGEKISPSFSTKAEVLKHVISSELVAASSSADDLQEDDLALQGMSIGECPPDGNASEKTHGLSEFDIQEMIDKVRQSAVGKRRIVNSIRPSGS